MICLAKTNAHRTTITTEKGYTTVEFAIDICLGKRTFINTYCTERGKFYNIPAFTVETHGHAIKIKTSGKRICQGY